MKKILLAFIMVTMVLAVAPNLQAKNEVIESTQLEQDYEKALKIADRANATIEKLVYKAQLAAEKHPVYTQAIIDMVVEKTNAVSARAVDKIDKLGLTAICEFETYTIGDQEVEIDPLRVFGW